MGKIPLVSASKVGQHYPIIIKATKLLKASRTECPNHWGLLLPIVLIFAHPGEDYQCSMNHLLIAIFPSTLNPVKSNQVTLTVYVVPGRGTAYPACLWLRKMVSLMNKTKTFISPAGGELPIPSWFVVLHIRRPWRWILHLIWPNRGEFAWASLVYAQMNMVMNTAVSRLTITGTVIRFPTPQQDRKALITLTCQ